MADLRNGHAQLNTTANDPMGACGEMVGGTLQDPSVIWMPRNHDHPVPLDPADEWVYPIQQQLYLSRLTKVLDAAIQPPHEQGYTESRRLGQT